MNRLRFRSTDDAFGFTALPNLVLLDETLTNPAKILYALLRLYARQKERCWPGQERLADHLGTSTRHVRTLLNDLKAVRLIDWERPDHNHTNVYWIEPIDQSTLVAERNSSSADHRNSSSAHEEDLA